MSAKAAIVTFKDAFIAPPSVLVGIAMWDIDHRHNARADLVAENITMTGSIWCPAPGAIPAWHGCALTGPQLARCAT